MCTEFVQMESQLLLNALLNFARPRVTNTDPGNLATEYFVY